MLTKTTLALAAAYLGSIVGAVAAVEYIGVVPVGFGYAAPAAVYVVGLTLVLRDLLQRRVGAAPAYALMLTGAALAALVSPGLALASAAAFLVSETVDFAIFSALQTRFLLAVAVSGAVALVVDSLLFLTLAFGSLQFLPGQIIGKATATLVAVAVLYVLRGRTRRPRTIDEAVRADLGA